MISVFRRSLLIFIITALVIACGLSVCTAESDLEQDPYDETDDVMITETIQLAFFEDDESEPEEKIDLESSKEVTNSISAKDKTLKVKSVKYDPEKSIVMFKFNQIITYKKTKAVIKYKNGKNMVTKITKYGPNYLKVKVKKLKYGRKYNYKLTGIRKFGSSKSTTLTGTFRAIDK